MDNLLIITLWAHACMHSLWCASLWFIWGKTNNPCQIDGMRLAEFSVKSLENTKKSRGVKSACACSDSYGGKRDLNGQIITSAKKMNHAAWLRSWNERVPQRADFFNEEKKKFNCNLGSRAMLTPNPLVRVSFHPTLHPACHWYTLNYSAMFSFTVHKSQRGLRKQLHFY